MIKRSDLRTLVSTGQAPKASASHTMDQACALAAQAQNHLAAASNEVQGFHANGAPRAAALDSLNASVASLLTRLSTLHQMGDQCPMPRRVELAQRLTALTDAWSQRPDATSRSWGTSAASVAALQRASLRHESDFFESLKTIIVTTPKDQLEFLQAKSSLHRLKRTAIDMQLHEKILRFEGELTEDFQAYPNTRYTRDEQISAKLAPPAGKAAAEAGLRPDAGTPMQSGIQLGAKLQRKSRVVSRKMAKYTAIEDSPPAAAPAASLPQPVARGTNAQGAPPPVPPRPNTPYNWLSNAFAWFNLAAPSDAPKVAHVRSLAPMTRAADNLAQIQWGQKTRVSPFNRELRALNLKHHKFSLLTGSMGQSYVMGTTRAKGGSGKLRPAVTEDGTLVAIKVARNTYKQGATYPTDPREFLQEAQLTALLQSGIERGMAKYHTIASKDTLRGVCEGTTPFEVYGVINVANQGEPVTAGAPSKMHMVMTKDIDSLYRLQASLTTPALQRHTSASFAAQVFTQLSILQQQEGYIHLDISLGNVTFTEKGQIRLMDFGRAQKVDGRGVAGVSHYLSSTIVPELVELLPASTYPRKPSTTAQDVFSLGACVAQLVAGARIYNPFNVHNLGQDLQGAGAFVGMQYFNDAFNTWKNSCRGPDGRVQASRINSAYDPNLDPLQFGPFFDTLADVHPALFELIINDAMELDPAERKNAAFVAKKARAMLPPPGSPVARTLAATMNAVRESFGDDALVEDAAVFKAWESLTRGTRDAPLHVRGTARPLP